MNAQTTALIEVAHALDELKIPYMLIGGMANAVWGQPRATLDVDITIWVEEARVQSTVRALVGRFRCQLNDPVDFVHETRVLPLQTIAGVQLDLLFGTLPFEESAIQRAVDIDVEGHAIRVATAEDLILHKILSDRDQDQRDAEAIIARRLAELDQEYLEPRIRELAHLLEKPEILQRWQQWSKR